MSKWEIVGEVVGGLLLFPLLYVFTVVVFSF